MHLVGLGRSGRRGFRGLGRFLRRGRAYTNEVINGVDPNRDSAAIRQDAGNLAIAPATSAQLVDQLRIRLQLGTGAASAANCREWPEKSRPWRYLADDTTSQTEVEQQWIRDGSIMVYQLLINWIARGIDRLHTGT